MSLVVFTTYLLLLQTVLLTRGEVSPGVTPMDSDQFVVQTIESPVCDLGEGPHWHANQSALYYVDAFMGYIHRYQVKENKHSKVNLGDLVTIVIPIENDSHLLVSLRNKVC